MTPYRKTESCELYLGNCVDVLREFPDESIHFVCTSPPYPGVCNMWGELFKPENFEQAHLFLDSVWGERLRILKPGCKLVINIANTGRSPYLANVARIYQWAWNKIEPKGEIIWNKTLNRSGNTQWGSWRSPSDVALEDSHEYILVFRKFGKRESPTHEPTIDSDKFLEYRKSVWNIPAESAKRVGHIAPFPREIPNRLITLYTFGGETVLDPFVGSGTTLMSAQALKRKGIGIDIKPENMELSALRLQQTAGF